MTNSFQHKETEAAALGCRVGGHFSRDPHFTVFSPALQYILKHPSPVRLKHMSNGFAESEPEIWK